ncbi:MAG: hypothetical protein S4CHLAM45_12130 [Chlamydiales bacterium]|nr:hypothetical protein [Chlamydiales bacterium]MCH9619702.1 hypothetical protein [Chlamydiales bacterium]MCH9623308.1 hypothetical protein [Chlamydiales bacterium]
MTTAFLIFALILGFYVAWTIGANDVANAVGTAVGSGSLTLRQAVIIAAIFEFAGALFLGSNVSQTVETGIVNPVLFINDSTDFILGMIASLVATGVWLQIASYFGWPVSTTHSIVGAVLGFGLVLGGYQFIIWGKIGSIAISWVISPILGGTVAYLIFSMIRKRILYDKNPLWAAKKMTPWLVFFTFFSLTVILFFGGLRGFLGRFNLFELLSLGVVTGGVAALIAWGLLRRLKLSKESLRFDLVEKIFVKLQIIVTCFMAFAHGSNDVANVIGPLSGIINALQGKPILHHTIPFYLLVLGGIGIVIGLATWGWRVIETVGKKITALTPSRGFAAGLGAAVTIMLASKLGLPISTTHVIVGAVLGVGFARGLGAINLDTIRDIVISWVVTVPVGAALSILFFLGLRWAFMNAF